MSCDAARARQELERIRNQQEIAMHSKESRLTAQPTTGTKFFEQKPGYHDQTLSAIFSAMMRGTR